MTDTTVLQNGKRFFKNKINPIKYNTNCPLFENIEEVKQADLKDGDVVYTRGYYHRNDGGSSCYKIMTYDQWWSELPEEIKLVSYGVNDLGYFTFVKILVDEWGNHTLNNGLVAKYSIPKDGIVRVEQWGCKGRSNFNNNDPLKHLFGQIKTGTIQFGKNKIYKFWPTYYNRAKEEYERLGSGYISNGQPRTGGFICNEYGTVAGSWLGYRCNHNRPIIYRCKNLVLDGNGSTLFTPKNRFVAKGNAMGMFDLIKNIDGLEIKNFIFDGNGLNQLKMYNADDELTTTNMRTTNHGIFYTSATFNDTNNYKKVLPNYGIDEETLPYKFWEETGTFNNVNIHDNKFYRLGTGIVTGDCGGDAVLIMPPAETHDVTFENNYVEDVGRWFFAVDLVHDYADCTNYTIRNNINTITDKNYVIDGNGNKRYRGLGWIDFEATRRWVNLIVEDNYTDSLTGFAMNGRFGEGIELNDTIIFRNNTMKRASLYWYSAYTYDLYWYNAASKNVYIENNYIHKIGEASNLQSTGRIIENAYIRNNKIVGGLPFCSTGNIKGDFIFDGNERISLSDGNEVDSYGNILDIDVSSSTPNNVVNFEFTNNRGGIASRFASGVKNFSTLTNWSFKFENNEMTTCNVVLPKSNIEFDINQFRLDLLDDYTASYGIPCIRGAINIAPYYCNKYTLRRHSSSGLIYDKDEIIAIEEAIGVYKVCTRAGYLPVEKELFGTNSKDVKLESYTSLSAVSNERFVYTADNVYKNLTTGSYADALPTHTEGTQLCGEVEFEWLYPTATWKYKLIRDNENILKVTLNGDEPLSRVSVVNEYLYVCLSKQNILDTYGASIDISLTSTYKGECDKDFMTYVGTTTNNKNYECFAVNDDSTQHFQFKISLSRLEGYTQDQAGIKAYLADNNITFYVVKKLK